MKQGILYRPRCLDDKHWQDMYWNSSDRPIGFNQCIVSVYLMEDTLPNGFAITLIDVTDKLLYFQSQSKVRRSTSSHSE